jgi:hypothetical protein
MMDLVLLLFMVVPLTKNEFIGVLISLEPIIPIIVIATNITIKPNPGKSKGSMLSTLLNDHITT